MSSTNAAISGADDPDVTAEAPAGTGCPARRRKAAGSNPAPGAGSTAASTSGSARAARDWRTPSQIGVAGAGVGVDRRRPGRRPSRRRRPDGPVRMVTASSAPARVAGTTGTGRRARRPSRAAACSRQRRAVSVCPAQNAASETVRPTRPRRPGRGRGPARSAGSRSRAPATTRSPPGRPARRCGSKTATGPRRRRAARVTARVSGRVEVATTGARGVEHPRDDHVQALAHPGRADQQDRVLDRAPHLPPAQPPDPVPDRGRRRPRLGSKGRAEGGRLGADRALATPTAAGRPSGPSPADHGQRRPRTTTRRTRRPEGR